MEQDRRRSCKDTPGVEDWFQIGGLSLLDQSSAPNAGTVFVTFDALGGTARQGPHARRDARQAARRSSATIQEAIDLSPSRRRRFAAWASAAASKCMVQDRGDLGRTTLFQVVTEIIEDARSQSRPGRAQHHVPPRRAAGVSSTSTAKRSSCSTFRSATCSPRCRPTSARRYVNDFNKFGRVYQVRVQAEPNFRAEAERHPPARSPQSQRRDGAARHAGHGPQSVRPADHQSLQPVSRRRRSPASRRRASARARRST